MDPRTVIVIVAGLLAQKVATDNAPSNAPFDNVQNFLESTMLVLDETATNVTLTLEDMAKEQQAMIEKISDSITSRVTDSVLKVQENAVGLNADVGECFKKVPAGSAAIVLNVTQGAVKCVVDQVEKAKVIVASLLGLVKEVNTTLVEAKKDLSRCKSLEPFWIVAICQGQVTTKLSLRAAQIALEASQLVAKAVNLVSTAKQNVEVCISSKLLLIPSQIMALVKELVDCVLGAVKIN